MDERDFLYSLCAEALDIEYSIKFAAVINHEGKLLVGTSRRSITTQQDESLDNNLFKSRLNHSNYIFLNGICNSNSFINKNALYYDLYNRSDFRLIHINKNIFVALIPLNEEQDKFLCIYFESSNSLHKTLLKLNTIFEYEEINF